MTDLETLLAAICLALGFLAAWWLRRGREEALLTDLGRALALVAEAQQVCWRLERHYADDLDELARVRRELLPFIDGARHGRATGWERRYLRGRLALRHGHPGGPGPPPAPPLGAGPAAGLPPPPYGAR